MIRHPRARRGAVYVIVLATGLVVSAAGIAAMDSAASGLAATRLRAQGDAAAAAAQSALELALHTIAVDPAWTETVDPSGGFLLVHALDGVSVSVEVSDPADGDLSAGEFDPVRLTAYARTGDAERSVTALFDRSFSPIAAMSASLWAHGRVDVDSGVRVQGARPVGSNADVQASGSTVETPAHAAGTVTGSSFVGGVSPGVVSRAVPGAEAMASFVASATRISISALPSQRIDRQLVSPQHNPAGGPANPRGIYLIDCDGANLIISDSRILGTLIIEDVGRVTITGGIHMAPAQTGLPTLLVNGPLEVNLSNTQVSEASAGRNLNPPGAPFAGATDGDTTDSYPARIEGLVHTTGEFRTGGAASATINGAVLTRGAARFGRQTIFFANAALDATPPAGYRTGPAYLLRSGSWTRTP